MSQRSTRNTFVASEGVPFLMVLVVAGVVGVHYYGVFAAVAPAALLALAYFVFRDPHRPVPAVPLGVVSPVDGEVIAVGATDHSITGGEAQTISIRVDAFGTYTARAPVEGKIMDIATDAERPGIGSGGLWIRTDEKDDVVLGFSRHRFGLPPRAFVRYGERVGQGQRCAFIRLARVADVQVPVTARIQVKTGQQVTAGSDVLARLPHH
ncbi:MAG: hypothetical protein R3315_09815 [Woeseiaceae bacterium]|nr:hypothetical protein [Woeseiaceae bacterium]